MVSEGSGVDTAGRTVDSTVDIAEARRIALSYWQEQFDYYVKHAWNAKRLFFASQVLTIVLAALTPVLILGASGATWIPPWVQALPAALAAIIAGLSGTFRWQRNFAAFTTSMLLLESEHVKFLTQATSEYQTIPGDLDSERRAISNFVQRIASITLNETQGWNELLLSFSSQPGKH
jgi:hypothetical protein